MKTTPVRSKNSQERPIDKPGPLPFKTLKPVDLKIRPRVDGGTNLVSLTLRWQKVAFCSQ